MVVLLRPRSICMQICGRLVRRQHRHCHLTQYTVKHRWPNIDSCTLNSASKEALTRLPMPLVSLFHSLLVKRFPVRIVSAYRHDVFNSLMHLHHAAFFCWQLDLTATQALTHSIAATVTLHSDTDSPHVHSISSNLLQGCSPVADLGRERTT